MALSPGVRLGPYEILDALAAGGMGEVYRARDTRLDRTVSVDDSSLTSFQRCNSAAALRVAGRLELFPYGITEGLSVIRADHGTRHNAASAVSSRVDER
jgi:serine/threonine protein kinase